MRIRALPTLLVGLLVSLAIGGAALASSVAEPAPLESSTVKACIGKKNAVVSATSKGKCPKGTLRVTLNQTGPAGPTGPAGSPGMGATATTTVTVTPAGDSGEVIDGGAP